MGNDDPILMAPAPIPNPIRQETIDRAEPISLKRKRPLKIEIPAVLSEIPVDVFKECGGRWKGDEPVCFAESGVGVYSLKGKKKFMEDSHRVYSSSNGDKVV